MSLQIRFMQLYVLNACQVVRIPVQRFCLFFFFFFFLCVCFQGFWVEICACIILPVYADLIMRTQACSYVHMNLPINPNFILFVLLLSLHVCFVQLLSPCFYSFNVYVSHVCLPVCYHTQNKSLFCVFLISMP